MDIEKNSPEEVGNLIKSFRTDKKMTQSELADKLHVSASAVSKWERGVSLPDIYMLQTLTEVFGVPLSSLLYKEQEQVLEQNATAPPKAKKKHGYIWAAFAGGVLLTIVILLIYHETNTFRARVVDEFLDTSADFLDYQSVYYIAVEYKGKITAEDVDQYSDELQIKYQQCFNESEVIVVSFWEDYQGRDFIEQSDPLVVLFPMQ